MIITEERRQQLIADAKVEIARIEKMLPFWAKNTYTLQYLRSQLERQQISLAALEAKPIDEACYRTYYPDSDEESHRPHSESGELCARRIAGEIGGYVEKVLIIPDGHDAYTAPPVPVMKPIELPDGEFAPNALNGHKYIKLDDAIAAIRAAGYEVKGGK